jgi:hypothetical protein
MLSFTRTFAAGTVFGWMTARLLVPELESTYSYEKDSIRLTKLAQSATVELAVARNYWKAAWVVVFVGLAVVFVYFYFYIFLWLLLRATERCVKKCLSKKR